MKNLKKHLESRLKHAQKRLASLKIPNQEDLLKESSDYQKGYNLGFDAGYWGAKESSYLDQLDELEDSEKATQQRDGVNKMIVIEYNHPLHGLQVLKCEQLLNKDGVLHVQNIHGSTYQTIDGSRIQSINALVEPEEVPVAEPALVLTPQDIKKLENLTVGQLAMRLETDILHTEMINTELPLVEYIKDYLEEVK